MKKQIKKSVLICIGSMIMLGLSGCIKGKEELPFEDQVLQYMEEKYGEEFEFIMGDTQSWRDSHREAYVSSNRFPGEEIYLKKDFRGMQDSYVNLLMEEEAEQEISVTVSSVFPENKVFLTRKLALLPYKSKTQMSIEDYLHIEYLGVNFTIVIPKDPSNKEQDLSDIYEKLKEKGYAISFYFIYLEESTFEIVGKTDYDYSILTYEEATQAIGSFTIDNEMNLDYVDWR